MTEPYISINGAPMRMAQLHVPNAGAWALQAESEDEAPAVTGRVTVRIGDATLQGRALDQFTGTHALSKQTLVVGGNGSWGKIIPERDYRNDANVKARTVADDAARECGEAIGSFAPTAEQLGVHFARPLRPASWTLDRATGESAIWWLGYDGITRVGQRTAVPAPADQYEVLEYSPQRSIVKLAVESLLTVGVGSVLNSDRLDKPLTIQSFDLIATQTEIRMLAVVGSSGKSMSQLELLFRGIVERVTDGQVFGSWRYRVLSMSVDGRVNLQIVNKRAGLPDALPVEQWAGTAGGHAELAQGAIVLVEFIEGDVTLPRVVGYAGKGNQNRVPVSLEFCGPGRPVARLGDLCRGGGAGTVVTFAPVTPALGPVVPGVPYLISFSAVPPTPVFASPLFSAVASASGKVSAG